MLGCSFRLLLKSSEIIPMEPEPVNPGVGSRLEPSSATKFKRCTLFTIDSAKLR